MSESTENLGLILPDFNQSIWHDEVNGNFTLLDEIIFAITGIGNFVGAWTNSTAYTAGQRVFDNDDGGIWHCNVTHTSAAEDDFEADRTLNPTFWSSVGSIPNVQGAWDNSTVYATGTIVYDATEGLFGQANNNHTSPASGTMRDDIANWDIIFDWQLIITAADIQFTPGGTVAATNVQAAIAEVASEKAALASPTFTGVPAAPTASPGTNTTQLSTTAFVTAAVTQALADIRAGVAGAFDTLAEIVAGFVQLGNTSYLHPVGSVIDYAGATEPSGWIFCFGQAISRTTFSALFTAIGTTYGVGDGSTTFNVPDCRGRVVAGQDDMGGVSANRLTSPINGDTLGAVGGTESITLVEANLPAHTHSDGTLALASNAINNGNLIARNVSTNTNNTVGGGGNIVTAVNEVELTLTSTDVTGATGSTGSGTAVANIPPTIIMNKIIKT